MFWIRMKAEAGEGRLKTRQRARAAAAAAAAARLGGSMGQESCHCWAEQGKGCRALRIRDKVACVVIGGFGHCAAALCCQHSFLSPPAL